MLGNMYTWPDTGYFAAVAALCVTAAILAGVVGGLYPARRMSRLEPYEAIRKGE
jgi:ABC-type antimicrobial peptide transport system permease subunit